MSMPSPTALESNLGRCELGPVCLSADHCGHCGQHCSSLKPVIPETPPTSPPARSWWMRVVDGAAQCCVYVTGCCICCCYTTYVLCPPIPRVITRKLAFHPPSTPRYDFVVRDATGSEILANAKQCLKRNPLRIEVTPPIPTLEGIYPFVVETDRGNALACVYVPCPLLNRPPLFTKKVMIFCQPNSSNLVSFIVNRGGLSFNALSARSAVDVYAFDYSGFGISSGKPSEENIYADIRAVYKYVRSSRPDCEIYLMGISMGTAASVDLAATNPKGIAGVILVAPFASGLSVLLGKCREGMLFDSFRSLEKISKVNVPILIAHGFRDTVVPFNHGIELATRAKRPVPFLLLRNANHINIFDEVTSPLYPRILTFLATDSTQYDQMYNREEVIGNLQKRLQKLTINMMSPKSEKWFVGRILEHTNDGANVLLSELEAESPYAVHIYECHACTGADCPHVSNSQASESNSKIEVELPKASKSAETQKPVSEVTDILKKPSTLVDMVPSSAPTSSSPKTAIPTDQPFTENAADSSSVAALILP